MTTPESQDQDKSFNLTWQNILSWTGYHLAEEFTGFARNNGEISPDLHEERERLSRQYGEDNVLTSFFVTNEGDIALGLFVRGVTDWNSIE